MGIRDNAINIFEEQRALTDDEMRAYKDMLHKKENNMGVNCEADFCQWYDLDLDDCSLEYIEDSNECNRVYGVSRQWLEENDDSYT